MSLITSCASKKEMIYFQPDSSIVYSNSKLSVPVLKNGDILTISVTADDIRATVPFNQVNAYQGGTIQNTNPFIPTYTIADDGTIDFPKIGRIKLAGFTRTQAVDLIRSEVSKFIVNPGVNISLRNFKITVLGEVRSPGSFFIENDRITLLEAIGMAGDLTINGVRNNVLVIREVGGDKTEYRVDLTSRSTFNSPVYYLSQNDVVYVEPNGAKIQSSKYTQNTSIFVSIASVIITVISVLTR